VKVAPPSKDTAASVFAVLKIMLPALFLAPLGSEGSPPLVPNTVLVSKITPFPLERQPS